MKRRIALGEAINAAESHLQRIVHLAQLTQQNSDVAICTTRLCPLM